jgi:hypothetical protein
MLSLTTGNLHSWQNPTTGAFFPLLFQVLQLVNIGFFVSKYQHENIRNASRTEGDF